MALLITLISLIACLLFARWYVAQNSSPWFGRGANLSAIPYRIVVGPVDAKNGIPGFITPGMQRDEVERHLGYPLVKGMTIKDAEHRGFIDPEDITNEFFDGVFAWVQFGSANKVISITFDLVGFAQKFRGDQRVLLQYRGQTYLLHKGMSQEDVVTMFRDESATSDITIQGSEVIVGKGTALTFQSGNGKLRTITIIAL
jgi:hypothetical protein